MKTKKLEIYYHDLTMDAQKDFDDNFGDPSTFNHDICPLFVYEQEDEDGQNEPEEDNADTLAEAIRLIKERGERSEEIFSTFWHVPGGQQCKLPRIYADTEEIHPCIYIELLDISFFVVENPGNIDGSIFYVYCNKGIDRDVADKIKSMIKNSQDAVGIKFFRASITTIK